MAILRNKHTCNTAVAATTIVGSGNVGLWAAFDLAGSDSKVFLVNRTGSAQPFTSHHQQHPNIQILTHTRVIDVEDQVGDRVVSPYHELRAGDIELCIDRGCTSLVTRYSLLVTPYHY